MHLVFNHVAELEHVNHAYGSGLVKALAGTAVIQVGLAVAGQSSLVGPFVEVVESGAVKDGSGEFLAELAAGPTENGLENLTEVHTRGHTQRVEADVDRRTVGKEGHVFLTHDARYDTFVTVAACHLVTHANLTLLGDVDLGNLHDA